METIKSKPPKLDYKTQSVKMLNLCINSKCLLEYENWYRPIWLNVITHNSAKNAKPLSALSAN